MTALVKRRWRNVLLLLCSLAASFVIAEAGLRYFSMGYLDHPTNGHPVLHHVQPPNFKFDTFDIAGEFEGNSVIYDKNGLRIPHGGFKFDPSRKDVVFLGDSFVESSEIPYEETFVALFGESFEDLNARNFGVSSYSPLLSYLQLKYFKTLIDPVLIVHLVFENDLEDDKNYYQLAKKQDGEVTAVPGDPNGVVHELLRGSYVARLANRARLTIQALMTTSLNGDENGSSNYLEDRDLGEITPQYLNKISDLAKEDGIRYLLMCVPSKVKFNEMREHRDICEKIKEFSTIFDIEYVDLDDYFSRNANGQKPFFDKNIHFKELGHRLTYLALLGYLKSHPLSVP